MKVVVIGAEARGLAADTKMQNLATPSSRRNAILCALLVAACMALTYPVAGVPSGDDFSYSRTALDFARTGHILYNGWATAMLGWQVPWGALFIKLFGFSFTILRLSTLPIAMASVYLLHQILVRFGIGARDAALGALTLGLSPIFLLTGTTYLTDVPGAFVIVVCLYMCQRAVVAQPGRTALAWLVFAGIVNLIGGTVRQTSWLGVLVMVPATAWFLRKQRGMIPAAAATVLLSLVGIAACMHWATHQPFFVPEPFFVDARYFQGYWYLLGQYGKALLCLLLLLSPIAVGWLAVARSFNRTTLMRIGLILSAITIVLILRAHHGSLAKWLMPWLIPFLIGGPDTVLGGWTTLSIGFRAIVSLMVIATGLIMAEYIFGSFRDRAVPPLMESPYWRAAIWLAGPFVLAYLLVLGPRASTSFIQDRYLLVIIPPVIVLLLLMYERWIAPALPALSFAVLILLAYYGVADAHDRFADLRAGHTATQELLSNGVPRTAIVEGFGPDLWVQVEATGYVNSGNMVAADKYYKLLAPSWPLPPDCVDYLPQTVEPVIQPKYFIASTLTGCLAPTSYPPVPYRAWLPPFHRTRLVEQPLPTPDKIK
jgi:hypothetical protein